MRLLGVLLLLQQLLFESLVLLQLLHLLHLLHLLQLLQMLHLVHLLPLLLQLLLRLHLLYVGLRLRLHQRNLACHVLPHHFKFTGRRPAAAAAAAVLGSPYRSQPSLIRRRLPLHRGARALPAAARARVAARWRRITVQSAGSFRCTHPLLCAACRLWKSAHAAVRRRVAIGAIASTAAGSATCSAAGGMTGGVTGGTHHLHLRVQPLQLDRRRGRGLHHGHVGVVKVPVRAARLAGRPNLGRQARTSVS